jgi:hypothetical protein
MVSSIDRPSIDPNCLRCFPALLEALHILVVALSAQAHQLATIKQIDVAVMRNDVMRDTGCRDSMVDVAALLAERVLT